MKRKNTLNIVDILQILPSPVQYYLTQFKESLTYNIKKKLTLHYKSLGKKTSTIPCSEEEGNKRLENLLGNEDWSIRYFDNNQFAYIDIVNFE
ncbi:8457_t:CDS:2, partial [Entrophospora sp. SA101]